MKDSDKTNTQLAAELNELKESERLYRSLVDNANSLIIALDTDARIVTFNAFAEDLTGYKKKEVLGRNWFELFVPERDRQQISQIFEKVLQQMPEYSSFENPICIKNGEERLISWRNSVVKDKKGNPNRVLTMGIDITVRSYAEAALMESENHFRQFFENGPGYSFMVSAKGTILDVNKAALKTLGYEKQELISKPVTMIYTPKSRPRMKELFQKWRETGELKDMEAEIISKEGKKRTVLLSSNAVRDHMGNLIHSISVQKDITELKEAMDRANSSLKEKEVLLREIHHRVKNNMQIISSLLRIQARTIEDKTTREMFQVGQNRIKTMALIHEKLYRAEDLAKIDFSDYLEGLTSHLMSVYRVQGTQINLQMDISEVNLDINRAIPCGLIINELVTNSLKHAFPPGCSGTLEIKMKILDGQYQLLIKDNGVGFPSDKDFRKLETLGIQIVLDLVDQMSGTIDLNQYEGTEFKINFP